MLRRLLPFGLLLLVGCGGSGDSSSGSARVQPRVSIDWPARSRNFAAPSSALSVAFIFEDSLADGSDQRLVVDRSADLSAVTQTYPLEGTVRQGRHALNMLFYSEKGGAGDVVGMVAVDVLVAKDGTLKKPNGTTLGSVGFEGGVASTTVDAPDGVDVGVTQDLFVSNFDSNGEPIVVSPGSVKVAVTSGEAFLRANDDATVTGLAEGTASVVATVDGKASEPTSITVRESAIAIRSLDLKTGAIVSDLSNGLLWATIPDEGRVVSILPSSGEIVGSEDVGGRPEALSMAADGKGLFIGIYDRDGLSGASVRYLGFVSGDYVLPTPFRDELGLENYRIADIAARPESSNSFAVTYASETSSASFGPVVYSSGSRQSRQPNLYGGIKMLWIGPARLLAFNDRGSPIALQEYAVTAEGATKQRETILNVNYKGNDVVRADGRVYMPEGSVLDESTLEIKHSFFPPNGQSNFFQSYAGPVASANQKNVLFVEFSELGCWLHVYRRDNFALIVKRKLTGAQLNELQHNPQNATLVRWGSHGLALRTSTHILFLDDVPGL